MKKILKEFWGLEMFISSSFPGLSYCLVGHIAFYGRPAGTDTNGV